MTILLTDTVLSKHSIHGVAAPIPASRLPCSCVPNEALRGLGIGLREAPIPGAVAPMVAVGWWASACVLFTGI
jgi:hypothetical protein